MGRDQSWLTIDRQPSCTLRDEDGAFPRMGIAGQTVPVGRLVDTAGTRNRTASDPSFRIGGLVLGAGSARRGQPRQVGGRFARRASFHESPSFDMATDRPGLGDRLLPYPGRRRGGALRLGTSNPVDHFAGGRNAGTSPTLHRGTIPRAMAPQEPTFCCERTGHPEPVSNPTGW